jgi:hypothetical protein
MTAIGLLEDEDEGRAKKKPGDDTVCRVVTGLGMHGFSMLPIPEAPSYQPLAQKIVNSTRRFISLPSFVAFVVR